MTTRFDNTRRARLAQVLRTAGALAALALLAGQGTSLALGQETTATMAPGFFLGTSTVNGTALQAQLGFVTNSTSASYVPTVSLQFGISYSAGPVSCTQTVVPVNNPGVPVPYVQTCTVTITFTPQYPGGHRDALYIAGVSMGSPGAFLYGIGLAPQLMIQPGVTTSLNLPGNPYFYGSTTDDTGTYYVYANNDIYTVKDGVATELAGSVPQTSSLSIDGAGQLWEPGYPGVNDLCYGLPYIENQNPVIAAASVCFQNPVAVTTGTLGTYYDADGGGESISYDGQTTTFIHGLLVQQYQPDTIPETPSIVANTAYGEAPLDYPIGTNFGPNGIAVDPYENLFFTDPNNGVAVWCGWGLNTNGITGNSNGCGGWGHSMVQINQYIGTNPTMAVDAADTLYASQNTVQMFPASNNYASPIAGIGYGGSVSLTPDGTVYVGDGSTLYTVNRSQGSINFGSNNGQTPSPYPLTLYNGGNQPLTISSIVASGSAAYTVEPAASNGCTNGITLAVGTVCQLLVTSTVPHAGTLTGAVAITSNSLNAPGTVQTVALTGYTSGIWVAATPNPYVFPAQTAGTTSVPLPVTVTNTSDGSNAAGYGSTVAITSGFTSSNPAFTASLGDPTAQTYCGNPLATGATCLIQVTFNPSAATSYSGTISWYEQITGGGPSMKVSFAVSGNGTPVPLLVPISETIQVTDSPLVTPSLLIAVNEAVHVTDAEPGTVSAVLLSPTPGLSTLLGTTNVAFQWATGVDVSDYQLNLSAIAAGDTDLYSYKGTATSAVAAMIPANGVEVFARLYSKINGVWQYNDYVYTESGTPTLAALTSPTPGLSTILGTTSVQFQWTSGTDVSDYQLNLSAIAAGDSDLYTYKGTALSATASALPANGVKVYARLYSKISGTWLHNDYVYTEGGTPAPATLTSPAPGLGTILGTTSVTFQWTAGIAVTDYQLNLSAVAAGDSDLYTYKGTALTATPPALPANGAEVYARLYSKINGAWQYKDYVYTEGGTPTRAALTSPTPGLSTILGTSSVVFQWTAGIGVTDYQLNLSAIAAGDSDLYLYKGPATSATAPALPANGVKVYARLYSKINGVWQYNDYVYTEQ